MNTLQVLIDARKLIEEPKNWLDRCPTAHEEKCGRFCAARAIWSLTRRGGPDHYPAYDRAYRAVCEAAGADVLPLFNDTHTHAEVIAAFDRAIEAERTQAQSSAEGSGAA